MYKINKLAYTQLPFQLENDHVTRLFFMCSLFLVATLIIFIPANMVDTRVLDGMPVWHKPIRFGFSFIFHFLTLAVLSQLIDETYRKKYRFSFFAYAAAISMWTEYFYMAIQAARGRRSHFNVETELESLLYMLMGVGALFLVSVTFVLGILIWKYGKKDQSGLRLGAILGLILGSVFTLIFAGFMSSNLPYIEARLTGTPNLVPYLGWSRVTGDYKPAHFIATHMMQLLPLVGWLADKKLTKNRKGLFSARGLVTASALILTALTILVFIMAYKGIPLFPV